MSWSAGDCRALFQSTLPVWGATLALIFTRQPRSNFNPRSPCGERPCNGARRRQGIDFNPRSPCGERHKDKRDVAYEQDFNPRSPCGERLHSGELKAHKVPFQSTLPVWGATRSICACVRRAVYFNPRSPCGERPGYFLRNKYTICISIHAPRVGSDWWGLR